MKLPDPTSVQAFAALHALRALTAVLVAKGVVTRDDLKPAMARLFAAVDGESSVDDVTKAAIISDLASVLVVPD